MIPTPVPDDDLIDRYLAGELAPSERGAVERAIAERPALADLVATLGDVELAPTAGSSKVASGRDHSDGHIDVVWNAVARRSGIVAAAENPDTPGVSRTVRGNGLSAVGSHRSAWRGWFATGAAVAVVLVAVLAVRGWTNRIGESPLAVYTTANAQRRVVTLTDGSTITLGAGSTLRVRDGKGEREMQLVGEALFTVVSHPERPFTVRAGNSVTTVLGTTFGVRAYPTDHEARVAVFSGRVRVNQGRALDAGDVARVTADGRETVAREDVEGYRGWTQGELTFMDTPISTVVNDLSRWYDVDIRIATPALANDHFSASFRNASLEHVLHTLSVTLGARVERQGRLVIVHRP